MTQFKVGFFTPWWGEKYLGVGDVIRIPSRRFKGGYEYVRLQNILAVERSKNKIYLTIRYGAPPRQKRVVFKTGERTHECYALILNQVDEARENSVPYNV